MNWWRLGDCLPGAVQEPGPLRSDFSLEHAGAGTTSLSQPLFVEAAWTFLEWFCQNRSWSISKKQILGLFLYFRTEQFLLMMWNHTTCGSVSVWSELTWLDLSSSLGKSWIWICRDSFTPIKIRDLYMGAK